MRFLRSNFSCFVRHVDLLRLKFKNNYYISMLVKNKILISLDIKFFIDIKRFFAEAGAGMNYP